MAELMSTAIKIQHRFRDLINFRVWRLSIMNAGAIVVQRAIRFMWARLRGREGRLSHAARTHSCGTRLTMCVLACSPHGGVGLAALLRKELSGNLSPID
jgi:hypothetical protein